MLKHEALFDEILFSCDNENCPVELMRLYGNYEPPHERTWTWDDDKWPICPYCHQKMQFLEEVIYD